MSDTTVFAWHAAADHPAFAGHFPGNPIVPGVVLLDQALLFAGQACPEAGGRWEITNAKFLKPAGPGAQLEFRFTARTRGGLNFEVLRGEQLIASGTLVPTTA